MFYDLFFSSGHVRSEFLSFDLPNDCFLKLSNGAIVVTKPLNFEFKIETVKTDNLYEANVFSSIEDFNIGDFSGAILYQTDAATLYLSHPNLLDLIIKIEFSNCFRSFSTLIDDIKLKGNIKYLFSIIESFKIMEDSDYVS